MLPTILSKETLKANDGFSLEVLFGIPLGQSKRKNITYNLEIGPEYYFIANSIDFTNAQIYPLSWSILFIVLL